MRLAPALSFALLSLAAIVPLATHAATKADEGFAAMLLYDGDAAVPRNRITRAHAGDDVVYFIKWKEPVARSSLRCVVTGPDTDIDDTQPFETDEPNGFSVCPIETEVTDAGEYKFVQYLDGQKVGEATITLDAVGFFDRMSRRGRGKWILAAAALVVLGIYFVRRAVTGDTRSLKQLVRGESGAERAVAIAAATKGAASGLDGAAALKRANAPPAPPPPDPLDEFRKRLAADASHRPSSAEDAWSIARAARKAGDTATAVAALRGFDKAWPGHALVPEMYLFSAKMMAEDMGNPDMARRIAAHIVQKYPGHFAAPEAKRLLESLPQGG
jgi:TolA-binding protein